MFVPFLLRLLSLRPNSPAVLKISLCLPEDSTCFLPRLEELDLESCNLNDLVSTVLSPDAGTGATTPPRSSGFLIPLITRLFPSLVTCTTQSQMYLLHQKLYPILYSHPTPTRAFDIFDFVATKYPSWIDFPNLPKAFKDTDKCLNGNWKNWTLGTMKLPSHRLNLDFCHRTSFW
jgi:hypothetical protein